MIPEVFCVVFQRLRKPFALEPPNHAAYQCTVPLAPGPPGVNFPSSDTFSPGTAAPDVAVGEAESLLDESSDEAHAESIDPITKRRTARRA
jgi:hypothetical protein